ncbi:MAG: thiamine diphosphokinase [Bacteroidota bacterium]
MRALLIANGVLPSPRFVRELVSSSDLVVCADGGTRHALRLGIQPDVVIGDLDSLSTRMRRHLNQAKIIESANQNQTDLEKAIVYLLKRKSKSITVLGATGKRIDQTLANMALLAKYQSRVNLTLVDSTGEIHIVRSRMSFRAKPGATVSLLALGKGVRVTTRGLRYALKNEVLEFGSRGVSNEVIDSTVEIRVRGGRLLLIKLF